MTDDPPGPTADLSSYAADLAPEGRLRAAVNLGNPVLATGTPEDPRGVTVDLARALGERLDVEVTLTCSTAARDSLAALVEGRADVGFLAVDPAREDVVAFTAPYLAIEGVLVVPDGSPLRTPGEVDRPGIRVGVKLGSAYDLFLTRTLEHAEVVRGAEGVEVYADQGLEAGAGIRQPVEAWVAAHGGQRVLEPAFMQIRQAVAVPRDRPGPAVAALGDWVAGLVASGWVAARTSG